MNLQTSFVFQHFWLLCGLWTGGLGAVLVYRALSSSVAAGRLSADRRFASVSGFAIAVLLPCTSLWLLQLSVDAGGPDLLQWPQPQKTIGVGIVVACWTALLIWTWVGSGARWIAGLFAHNESAAARVLARPIAIRLLVIVIVAAGLLHPALRHVGSNVGP
ncbi:hypothetical protein [Luteimonas sp. 3794]|uniref:hypothetical protein n=1 Tax=Luteimonas sp. 3794 TaxID=2817730 RepID=UPI002861BB16|nr:hypothetical protein [Luteimonas sp. 3794]MDR6990151.1 hypothetical protein [Luteimonas sp. 3794]